jgi:putative transposase
MPRPSRLVLPGVPLHVIQRGNNRTTTFRDERDFERYRQALGDVGTHFRCAIHAYVLMTNHVHLLISPADASGPSRMMQALGRRYVPYVNGRHGRTGTLWEGRFKSYVIGSERHLLAVYHYIERNPLRAGMVDDPIAYRWSSHRHNAFGAHDALITPHAVYTALGGTPHARRMAYRALFAEPESSDEGDPNPLRRTPRSHPPAIPEAPVVFGAWADTISCATSPPG